MVFGEGDAAGRCEIAAGGCGHPVGISDTAGKRHEEGGCEHWRAWFNVSPATRGPKSPLGSTPWTRSSSGSRVRVKVSPPHQVVLLPDALRAVMVTQRRTGWHAGTSDRVSFDLGLFN